MKKFKVNRSNEELYENLIEQMEFLKTSISLYDRGEEREFKRIAQIIRILVHDTKLSHSLLGQLDMKKSRFCSTCMEMDPSGNPAQRGLIMTFLGQGGYLGADYYPLLDGGSNKKIAFKDWWNESIFIKMENDSSIVTLSRKEIVLGVANVDGGAHIGLESEEAYLKLSRHGLLGDMKGLINSKFEICKNPERATVRQIGHEILKTYISDYKIDNPFVGSGVFIGNMRLIYG